MPDHDLGETDEQLHSGRLPEADQANSEGGQAQDGRAQGGQAQGGQAQGGGDSVQEPTTPVMPSPPPFPSFSSTDESGQGS